MSDIEELAEELNNQEPVDIDKLCEAFDQIFYESPEGTDPVEAKHVKGLTISSPKDVSELVEKLEAAREAHPEFIQIGDQEYLFDSERSLSNLIQGIRIGYRSE